MIGTRSSNFIDNRYQDFLLYMEKTLPNEEIRMAKLIYMLLVWDSYLGHLYLEDIYIPDFEEFGSMVGTHEYVSLSKMSNKLITFTISSTRSLPHMTETHHADLIVCTSRPKMWIIF